MVICDRLIIAHWQSGASLKHDEAESEPWGQSFTSVNNSIGCFPSPAARSPNCVSWSMNSILSLPQCFCIRYPLHSHSSSSLSFQTMLSRSFSWQDESTCPSEEYSHVLHRLFLPLRSSSISLSSSPLDTIEQTHIDTRTHTYLYCFGSLPSSLSQHPCWCAHAACAQQVKNMQSPSLTTRTDSDQARSQSLGKNITRLAAIQSQSAN